MGAAHGEKATGKKATSMSYHMKTGDMATIDELPLSVLQRLLDDVDNYTPHALDTMLEWVTVKHEGFIPKKYLDE